MTFVSYVLSLAAAATLPSLTQSWTKVDVADFIPDSVKVFGENCKGDTGTTLSKDSVSKIEEARLRPSGGCVVLLIKDDATPKFVVERALVIPNKPAKPIKCPPGVKMTEKDKTSNTAMGLGGECVPQDAPAAN